MSTEKRVLNFGDWNKQVNEQVQGESPLQTAESFRTRKNVPIVIQYGTGTFDNQQQMYGAVKIGNKQITFYPHGGPSSKFDYRELAGILKVSGKNDLNSEIRQINRAFERNNIKAKIPLTMKGRG